MLHVSKILAVFKEYSTGLPSDHQDEQGFYVSSASGYVWIPMEYDREQLKLDVNKLQAMFASGEFRPAFCVENVGDLRPWPQLLFKEFSTCTTTYLQVAASILERIAKTGNGPSTITNVSILHASLDILSEIVGHRLENGQVPVFNANYNVGEVYYNALREIANVVIYVPSYANWANERIYRGLGTSTKLIGASVDITGPVDSEGRSTVDFQDVFVALMPVANFLSCPVPELYYNNSSTSYAGKIDPYRLTGLVDCLDITVQEELEIELNPKMKHETQKNISSSINKIMRQLVKHDITPACQVPPAEHERLRPEPMLAVGNIKYRYSSAIYFETAVPFNAQTIYAASILYSKTHGRKFFINELTANSMRRQKNGLYYRGRTEAGGTFDTKVEIEPRIPAGPGAFVFGNQVSGANWQMCFYKISFEHTDPSHVRQFEFDLTQLLFDIDRRFEDINIIARLVSQVSRDPVYVSPPEMSSLTKMFIRKEVGNERCADASTRPICIPRSYCDSQELALWFAQILANGYGKMHEIYVSSNYKIKLYLDVRNSGEQIDSFSGLYVSANVSNRTVINKSKIYGVVLPYVVPDRTRAESVEFVSPKYAGLTSDGIWSSKNLYTNDDAGNFFVYMKKAFPTIFRTGNSLYEYIATGQCSRLNMASAIGLCKQELFDHTPEEIVESFKNADPFIHYRIFEEIIDMNIIVMINADSEMTRAKIGKTTQFSVELAMEIPRHSAQSLRRFREASSLVVFKYYNDNWCYTSLLYSEPLTVAGSYSFQIPKDSSSLIPFGQVSAILDKHYYPTIAKIDYFLGGRINQIIETRHLSLRSKTLCQVVNADGKTISIDIRGSPSQIANDIIYLTGDGKPVENQGDAGSDADHATVTVFFKNPVINVPAPLATSGNAHILPVKIYQILAQAGTSMRIDDENLALFVGSEGSIFFTGNAPAEPSQTDLLVYQRPMTILLSLIDWCLVLCAQRGILVPGAGIVSAFVSAIKRRSDAAINGFCSIRVEHRFVPRVRDFATARELIEKVLDTYFNGFIPMDDETITCVESFANAEAYWLYRNYRNIKVQPMWYISGMHEAIPTEYVVSLAAFRPAENGSWSITQTKLQYEYAVSRFAARESRSSWSIFKDLTEAATATSLDDHSSFVRRFPNGAVMYAVELHNHIGPDGRVVLKIDHGKQILATLANKLGFGPDYHVEVIRGFAKLKEKIFTKPTLAVFNTSGAETNDNLGTVYRIRVYPPD